MKPFVPRLFLAVTHGLSDFLRDGSRAFSLIMLWMNAFCAVYIWAYWRAVELTTGQPPREMTVGVVLIVVAYILGDSQANMAYLKAMGGGFEQVPDQLTTTETTAGNIVTPVTGSNSTINLTTAESDITGQADAGAAQ